MRRAAQVCDPKGLRRKLRRVTSILCGDRRWPQHHNHEVRRHAHRSLGRCGHHLRDIEKLGDMSCLHLRCGS